MASMVAFEVWACVRLLFLARPHVNLPQPLYGYASRASLVEVLSLRLVGEAGARNDMGHAYSQWAPSMIRTVAC